MAMKGLLVLLANFVDGADVGMVESGGGAGFTAETFQGLRVLRDVVGKKLQGDKAAKLGVLGLVDDTHAAAAEFFDDAVMAQRLANNCILADRVVHHG